MATPAGPGDLLHDSVYAGLDALRASVLLDLCAYVHLTDGGRPQLWLRAPELGSLGDDEATELFDSLRALVDELTADGPREVAIDLCGFTGLAVGSAGPRSRGVHVVGRDSGPLAALDTHEREVVVALCRSTAAVHHAIEVVTGTGGTERVVSGGASPLQVGVELSPGGEARATVVVEVSGRRLTGAAAAHDSIAAVGRAVLDALGARAELDDIRVVELAPARVVLAVVRRRDGRQLVGACLLDGDPLLAGAVATLEAATRDASSEPSAVAPLAGT